MLILVLFEVIFLWFCCWIDVAVINIIRDRYFEKVCIKFKFSCFNVRLIFNLKI